MGHSTHLQLGRWNCLSSTGTMDGVISRLAPTVERLPRRGLRMVASPPTLLGRVFVVNAALVTLAVFLLAVTPLTVSNPATPRQLLFLAVGLAVLLAANFALLRVSLRPLSGLSLLMRRIDLLQPGARLEVSGVAELNELLQAFNEMLERLERERRVSSRRSLDREEGERQRIAAELHDEIGQGLTAILLQLSTVLADADEPVRSALLEVQSVARANLDEVRRIARQLRPTVLDDLGLPYALTALADAAEEASGLRIRRSIAVDVERLPQATELALYRIAQEALTNVTRHADASSVVFAFEPDRDRVRLAIADDGRGMLYAEEVEAGGIRGMRERATAVGADLRVITSPGRGTRIEATVRKAR
jgi:two-component system sensor histidine kinase UhpB